MHLFLNGLAAATSSGLTYLHNVVPYLSARSDAQVTLAVNPTLHKEFSGLPNIFLMQEEVPSGPLNRFRFEQLRLPTIIRKRGSDVLLSAGNFAIRNSPVPQILLSGNGLYTSADFVSDLRARHAYGLRADTYLKGVIARRSVCWADCTVVPSESFAQELRQWGRRQIVCIPHGFDKERFFRCDEPLPKGIREAIKQADDALRILLVSHYNYYRNFETVFRSLPIICERLGHRKIKLFLTCYLREGENPGQFRTQPAADLVRQLGIQDLIIELGTVPYRLLHKVYSACNLYVTAAYAETFAHPVVEAMACGLPVIASDIPVHREVCAGGALYFDRFSPEELADRIAEVRGSPEGAMQLSQAGLARSHDFSWQRHVDELLALTRKLISERHRRQ